MGSRRSELVYKLENLVHELSGRIGHRIAGIIEGKVTLSQYVALKILSSRSRCTASDIAAKMRISTSAVTPLIDKLAALNLVERSRDDGDRRVVWICLTENGNRLIREIEDAKRKAMDDVFSKFTESELDRLISILEKLNEAEEVL